MKITIEKNDGKVTTRDGKYCLLVTVGDDASAADTIFENEAKVSGGDICTMAAIAVAHAAESGDLPKPLRSLFLERVIRAADLYFKLIDNEAKESKQKPKAKRAKGKVKKG